jgi:uncharacterized membrane protein
MNSFLSTKDWTLMKEDDGYKVEKQKNDNGYFHIRKTVTFNRPASEVYQYMCHFPNFRLTNKNCSVYSCKERVSSRVAIWY